MKYCGERGITRPPVGGLVIPGWENQQSAGTPAPVVGLWPAAMIPEGGPAPVLQVCAAGAYYSVFMLFSS